MDAPFASRPFGWCQDYLHGPEAQHAKCDGGLGAVINYRCPCWCHREADVGEHWEMDLPWSKPLSMNDRGHWSKRAAEVAQYRQDAGWAAREAKIPKCERVRVTLVYEPRDQRRRDPLNLTATLKVVQDALVDVGVIPDDTIEYMETVTPLIDAPNGKQGRLWALVEKLA